MAECILSTAAKAVPHTPRYQLDPQARRAILAQADSAKTRVEIDRQKAAFEARNGGFCFGQKNQPDTHNVGIVNDPQKGQYIANAHSASFAAKPSNLTHI